MASEKAVSLLPVLALSLSRSRPDRRRAVKKQFVKQDTQIVAQFLSEVDFLEWQNRTGQTKGQWNEVLSRSEHARKTLYRAAAEKALDGLRTGHLSHFFDVLTQYGPRLLAEPEVTQAVETWWLAKWQEDVAPEYREVNRRNLEHIGTALSWIGSGQQEKLTPKERQIIERAYRKEYEFCKAFKKTCTRRFRNPFARTNLLRSRFKLSPEQLKQHDAEAAKLAPREWAVKRTAALLALPPERVRRATLKNPHTKQ